MQQALQVCAYLIGLPLEFLIIVALLRGEYRRYPLIFLYAVVDLVTTILEIQPGIAYSTASAADKKHFAQMFWMIDWVMQGLVFLLVISLVYAASRHLRPRRTLLIGVIGGTILVAAISFWAHFDPSVAMGRYMTPWTRDLNFYASVLDLGLWVLLIGSREKDYKLLLVTGALGIQFTGGAIGQALRNMDPVIVAAASDFTMITNVARIYIWWHAFRVRVPAEAGLPVRQPRSSH